MGLVRLPDPADWLSDPKYKPCLYPEHNPPTHIVLAPGRYRYTCPVCGHAVEFTVASRDCLGAARATETTA